MKHSNSRSFVSTTLRRLPTTTLALCVPALCYVQCAGSATNHERPLDLFDLEEKHIQTWWCLHDWMPQNDDCGEQIDPCKGPSHILYRLCWRIPPRQGIRFSAEINPPSAKSTVPGGDHFFFTAPEGGVFLLGSLFKIFQVVGYTQSQTNAR